MWQLCWAVVYLRGKKIRKKKKHTSTSSSFSMASVALTLLATISLPHNAFESATDTASTTDKTNKKAI